MRKTSLPGVKNRTISNETGSYLFAALPPGTYRIRAIGPGFRQLIYQGVELPVGARLQLNLKIELGEVTESLQVTAESDNLLGYNTASVGGTISG
ncbi:MAG: carboxypeptidase regulatory-like domain-containing protein [Bryobacterales bacterium]|nr:carboxypeptidase regulatory-like domain-containing protein [Bryobacterales bacterium]